MQTIRTIAAVNPDRTITVPLPPDVAPGASEVSIVVVVEELKPGSASSQPPLQFSAHDVGPWPAGFTVRREDIYDNDGR